MIEEFALRHIVTFYSFL